MPSDVAYKPLGNLKQIYPGGTLTPPKFIPSYYEFLSIYGKSIAKYNSAYTSTEKNIYEVPLGYTFFICSCWISCASRETALGGYYVKIYINDSSSTDSLLNLMNSMSSNGNKYEWPASISTSFPIPLKINGGDKINMKNSFTSGVYSYCGVAGFLIKNSNIPSL